MGGIAELGWLDPMILASRVSLTGRTVGLRRRPGGFSDDQSWLWSPLLGEDHLKILIVSSDPKLQKRKNLFF